MNTARWLSGYVLVVLVVLAGLPSAALADANCGSGVSIPTDFTGRLEQLKSELGDSMGNPAECAYTNPENGDLEQHTTTGLAYWRASTDTPTFFDGRTHTALTARGLVTWSGPSVDPPSQPADAPPAEATDGDSTALWMALGAAAICGALFHRSSPESTKTSTANEPCP